MRQIDGRSNRNYKRALDTPRYKTANTGCFCRFLLLLLLLLFISCNSLARYQDFVNLRLP